MAEPMPFTCPHCGKPFGFGPDAALLTVVTSVPFDEAAPCCGQRVTGVLGRNGEVAFRSSLTGSSVRDQETR